MPKEKYPPEDILWNGTTEDLDEWIDKVFDRKKDKSDDDFILDLSNIEG